MPRQYLVRRLWSSSLPVFIAAIAVIVALLWYAAEGERHSCEARMGTYGDGEQLDGFCNEVLGN